MSTTERISGRDLLLLRTARGIRQSELARAWGVTRQRVGQVESSRWPGRTAVDRYLKAIVSAEGDR